MKTELKKSIAAVCLNPLSAFKGPINPLFAYGGCITGPRHSTHRAVQQIKKRGEFTGIRIYDDFGYYNVDMHQPSGTK